MTIGLFFGLQGCDWNTAPVEEEALVVEAFLETGRPLPAVTLRQTRPLNETGEGEAAAATGADVTLVLEDRAIRYTEPAPGRYVPEESLVVRPQARWRLVVEWQGTTAHAQGRAPSPLEIEEVCVDVPESPSRAVQVDSLRRDSLDIPADQGYLYPIDVAVQWSSPRSAAAEAGPYWVRTQLRPDATPFPSEVVKFFLEPAEIRREDRFTRTDAGSRWKGVYAVSVDSNTATFPRHDLTTALVRGDTAFASFAQTRTDPDRREPISNVNGALGIATAVAIDSLNSDSLSAGQRRCWIPTE